MMVSLTNPLYDFSLVKSDVPVDEFQIVEHPTGRYSYTTELDLKILNLGERERVDLEQLLIREGSQITWKPMRVSHWRWNRRRQIISVRCPIPPAASLVPPHFKLVWKEWKEIKKNPFQTKTPELYGRIRGRI